MGGVIVALDVVVVLVVVLVVTWVKQSQLIILGPRMEFDKSTM